MKINFNKKEWVSTWKEYNYRINSRYELEWDANEKGTLEYTLNDILPKYRNDAVVLIHINCNSIIQNILSYSEAIRILKLSQL
jgi:hypothetical protein